jgi:ribosomal protein L28
MEIAFAWVMMAITVCANDFTNTVPQTQPTTNYIKAHRTFRRVDGQLYNIEKSYLWSDVKGRVVKVLTNGVVLRTVVEKSERYVVPTTQSDDPQRRIGNFIGGVPSGPVVKTRKWEEDGPEILLINHDDSDLTTGKIVNAKAMKTGIYTYGEDIVEKWDCGTPNIVPVVVTNTPQIQTGTNRQSFKPSGK